MLDDNEDRFAFSLEYINPRDFTGEPMRINLNSDQAIFRPPHKLGQVEWDFVDAQCKKLEALGFIQRSTQSMYAFATVVVRKKDLEGNYTDFRQCGDYRPLNMETTVIATPYRESKTSSTKWGRQKKSPSWTCGAAIIKCQSGRRIDVRQHSGGQTAFFGSGWSYHSG